MNTIHIVKNGTHPIAFIDDGFANRENTPHQLLATLSECWALSNDNNQITAPATPYQSTQREAAKLAAIQRDNLLDTKALNALCNGVV